MGTTVSDVTRENDGDREFGGFDALACGKDIPANAWMYWLATIRNLEIRLVKETGVGASGNVYVGLSKAMLIGRVFRFLEESETPWKDFMRYYIGRSLGINDNSRPNIVTFQLRFIVIFFVFWENLLLIDLGQPCTSKMYYLKRIEDCVTPVQARRELAWNRSKIWSWFNLERDLEGCRSKIQWSSVTWFWLAHGTSGFTCQFQSA
jgi:hypothetical protein